MKEKRGRGKEKGTQLVIKHNAIGQHPLKGCVIGGLFKQGQPRHAAIEGVVN